ncbi:MAG TPA: DUF402 domain-containing protein [Anaerolineales bacterium]|nr:DUF402 domain-containing protein [Anaerolineales bacterium]
MTRPGDPITVRKFDITGREMWRWPATLRQAGADTLVVLANFNAGEAEFFGLSFRRGDLLLETYHRDRWYNVFAVYDASASGFKGWYCNIARPAIWQDGEIQWVDLGLDVVVLPDRRAALLDQEEFAALDLSLEDRAAARAAADELLTHAQRGTGPFAPGSETMVDAAG